ncbi:MAG: hypothetical protein WKF78_14790 [Candidatus Limnocylindrales bacterium]
MNRRKRMTGLAGTGAMILVLSLSGVVAAANVLVGTTVITVADPTVDPTLDPIVDTSLTYEDVDGNGIDDDCQAVPATADEAAAAAAATALDANGDGVVSQSEGAQSAITGGKNCNHGGYLSQLAKSGQTCDATAPDATVPDETETDATETGQGDANDQGDDEQGDANDQGDDEQGLPETCVDKAAHDAAKADRQAKHEAAKAERKTTREAAKADRQSKHSAS